MVRRQKWPRVARILEWVGRLRSERLHRRELRKQQERAAQHGLIYSPYKGKRRLDRIFFS